MIRRTTLISALAVTLLSLAACVQGDVPRDQTPSPDTAPTLADRRPAPDTSPTPTPTAPLSLNVAGPSDGLVVSSAAVVVHGQTQPGATVSVGAQSVIAGGDGAFQLEVALQPGDNVLAIVATGAGGTRVTSRLTITFEAPVSEAFFLVIVEPQDQSIVSTRRISVAGQTTASAIVTVNGVGVQVSESGSFSTTVLLDAGPNLIDVVGSSPQGRVLSTVVAVIYRP